MYERRGGAKVPGHIVYMGGWIAGSPSIGEGKDRKGRFGTWDLALGMTGSDVQLLERRKVLGII